MTDSTAKQLNPELSASSILAALPTSIAQYPQLLSSLLPLSEKERAGHLRNLCLMDLYFLLRYGLQRRDTEHEWYLKRCREVQGQPDGYLDLWAREHGKSSIITLALTIQDIFKDPEITVGIFSFNRPTAKTFLNQIKREFETNEFLKGLFPDVLWQEPQKQSPKWSEDGGILVKRKGNPKEATVEAWGIVDGQPTGRHFKLRIYDDVVTVDSVSTSEQIAKTTKAWELSDNLGVVGGAVRTIGTRYHLYDTYATMLERGVVKPRIYPATHNGRMDGNPVYFSQEEWDRRKQTQSRFLVASQLLQNPLADEDATFRIDWLKSYQVRPRTINVYIMGDPSLGRSATSDNTAIAVVGVGVAGAKYLLDGYCHRMGLSQSWIALRDLYKKWSKQPGVQMVTVGWERYGVQRDKDYFEERMRLENVHFSLEELNWARDSQGQGKRERVERLEPDFRNGRFFLPITVWRNGQPSMWRLIRKCTNGHETAHDNPKCHLCSAETIGSAEIQYRPARDVTAAMMRAIEKDEGDLISKAIKRYDEERQVYDLTVRFVEEYSSFPFGAHDDLIDATSRLDDLEARGPTTAQASKDGEPPQYWDS